MGLFDEQIDRAANELEDRLNLVFDKFFVDLRELLNGITITTNVKVTEVQPAEKP